MITRAARLTSSPTTPRARVNEPFDASYLSRCLSLSGMRSFRCHSVPQGNPAGERCLQRLCREPSKGLSSRAETLVSANSHINKERVHLTKSVGCPRRVEVGQFLLRCRQSCSIRRDRQGRFCFSRSRNLRRMGAPFGDARTPSGSRWNLPSGIYPQPVKDSGHSSTALGVFTKTARTEGERHSSASPFLNPVKEASSGMVVSPSQF